MTKQTTLEKTKKKRRGEFRIRGLRSSRLPLGMKIYRELESKTLKDSQSKYAEKILDRYEMSHTKECSSPVEVGLNL